MADPSCGIGRPFCGQVPHLDLCETIAGRVPQKLLLLVTHLHCLPHSGSRQPPSQAHRERYSAYYHAFHWMLLS